MSAIPKKAKHLTEQTREGWPLVVFMWMFGLGILGYVVGRIALDAYPHPLHWASGVLGMAIGCAIGWAWYQAKGDVL